MSEVYNIETETWDEDYKLSNLKNKIRWLLLLKILLIVLILINLRNKICQKRDQAMELFVMLDSLIPSISSYVLMCFFEKDISEKVKNKHIK